MNKDFFSKFKENNLFTFLFFLLVSCCLWLLQVLNEEYETDIPFNVIVNNVPDNIELVDGDVEFGIRLHDRGTTLLKYKLRPERDVFVDFSELKKQKGVLSLPVSMLKKQVAGTIESTSSIVQYNEDTVYINIKQNRKLLPVRLNGKFDTAEHFEVSNIKITPADVMVSATPERLELMSFVNTEYIVKKYLKGDKEFTVRVVSDELMNVEPSVVKVQVSVSPLKVKKVRVPIKRENFPLHFYALWLPTEVELSFEVSESNYEMLGPGDFLVKLDYNDLLKADNGKVELSLVKASPLAKNIVIKPAVITIGNML